MNYVFIVNQQARDGELKRLWAEAEPHFTQAMKRSQVVYPNSAAETRAVAREFADGGGCCIVSVGGEGTMNRVMQGIVDSQGADDTVMALVPFGNVNDYAANLGMEKNWRSALRTLVEGKERRVGLAQLITPQSNDFALNIADIGFGASTAKRHSIDHELRWFKGRLKYNLLAMKSLLHWRNVPARISIDDEVIEGELALALAGFSPTLGGFRLLPHAQADSDHFAVTLGRDTSRLDLLKLMQDSKEGRLEASGRVLYRKASRVLVEPQSELVTQVDGEITNIRAQRIEFIAHPRRLRFMVPV